MISEAQKNALRKEFGAIDGVQLVSIVGRLTDWKGHRYMIEAMAIASNKTFKLAIVGSGSETVIAELKALVRKHDLGERVTIAGSRREIPAIMAASDLVVSTSTRPEAFGRVAIEAQVMGTPVIATAHGGSLETVVDGKTGFLVPPADSRALADATDAALTDPARLKTMGRDARQHVLANFTVEMMLEKEFSAYQAGDGGLEGHQSVLLDLPDGEHGAHGFDMRVGGQHFDDEILKLHQILAHAVEQEIGFARGHPGLTHDRPVFAGARKCLQLRFRLMLQPDHTEGDEIIAELWPVQDRIIPFDNPRLLQPAHTTQAGRCRNTDTLGKLDIGHATVPLELAQDFKIDGIEIGAHSGLLTGGIQPYTQFYYNNPPDSFN